MCYLSRCNFSIRGNDNLIHIMDEVYLKDVTIVTEDNNNSIIIGAQTSICGKTELAAIESTSITIGNDCLFSSSIFFRTGDSHSIVDENNTRINPSEDIFVGDHVWIGAQVVILKGSYIPSNSIIGYRSLVTKKLDDTNTIYAGTPAKAIKHNINWMRERI